MYRKEKVNSQMTTVIINRADLEILGRKENTKNESLIILERIPDLKS